MKENKDFSFLKRTINDKVISADNVFEFLMGEMDGELNDRSLQSLATFLISHPELEKEASMFRAAKMAPDFDVVFPSPDLLKRNLTVSSEKLHSATAEELIIASHEGDITDEEESLLQYLLSENPQQASLHELYKKIKLQPDLSLQFPDKSSLKHPIPIPLFTTSRFARVFSIAASVLLVIGLWFSAPSPEKIPAMADVITPTTTIINPHRTPEAHSPSTKDASERTLLPEMKTVLDVATPVQYASVPYPPQWIPEKYSTITSHSIEGVEGYTIQPVGSTGLSLAWEDPLDFPTNSRNKLTIESFSIDNLRYFTGGGNEGPRLLADISAPGIAEATGAHSVINSAGRNLVSQWSDFKTRVLAEVLFNRE